MLGGSSVKGDAGKSLPNSNGAITIQLAHLRNISQSCTDVGSGMEDPQHM